MLTTLLLVLCLGLFGATGWTGWLLFAASCLLAFPNPATPRSPTKLLVLVIVWFGLILWGLDLLGRDLMRMHDAQWTGGIGLCMLWTEKEEA